MLFRDPTNFDDETEPHQNESKINRIPDQTELEQISVHAT